MKRVCMLYVRFDVFLSLETSSLLRDGTLIRTFAIIIARLSYTCKHTEQQFP